MRGNSSAYCIALAASLLLASGNSSALQLNGARTQGGLVIGRVAPRVRVFLDSREVRVSPDGVFLFGFGRDAPSEVKLLVQNRDGVRVEKRLGISKRSYKVSHVNGLPESKVTPKPSDMKKIREDNAKIARVRKLDSAEAHFMTGFIWPATGRISGVFGSQRILNGEPRRPHNGIDIAAPRGTPVVAMAEGQVALANSDMFLTGKTVMINHGHGLTSIYIHMDRITVKRADLVSRGQQIGAVGMTGRATGPHLHWGVSLFNTKLDPALLVGSMEGVN